MIILISFYLGNRRRVFAHFPSGETTTNFDAWRRIFCKNVCPSWPETVPAALIVCITLSTNTLQAPPTWPITILATPVLYLYTISNVVLNIFSVKYNSNDLKDEYFISQHSTPHSRARVIGRRLFLRRKNAESAVRVSCDYCSMTHFPRTVVCTPDKKPSAD